MLGDTLSGLGPHVGDTLSESNCVDILDDLIDL
jgi:hypothetical protein